MRHPWSIDNYIQATTVSRAFPGLPVGIGQHLKRFTVGSDTYEFKVPGAYPLDLEELASSLVVTAETGTTPTIGHSMQECADPVESYTRINQGAGLTTSGTTLVVDSAALIPNSVIPILLANFTLRGDTYQLNSYEWCLSISKSTNTLTIEREVYQSGVAFSDNDFVFFSNSWNTIVDSAGNNIDDATFDHDGATSSAPAISRLALSTEGLTGLTKKFYRTLVDAPTSGNWTGRVDLAGRTRGQAYYG